MLTSIGHWVRHATHEHDPWSASYSWGRTIVALSTALTLMFNDPLTLFRPAAGIPEYPVCWGGRALSIFCLAGHPGDATFLVVHWSAVAILLLTATGWKPRLTCIPHWWIAWSLQSSGTMVDGGDQVAAAISLLLLPQALTDARSWHWGPVLNAPSILSSVLASSGMLAIRCQVAFIYLHACVAKLKVQDWANGTALYYFLSDPVFGASEFLRPGVLWLFNSPTILTGMTWGVVALEGALAAAIVMPMRWARRLFWLGVALHAGIGVVQGLFSFACVMVGTLILYLRLPGPGIAAVTEEERAPADARELGF